jgi:hypothetical protein
LSSLYDRFLPARLALPVFFADRYGAGRTVSFLEFCRVVSDEGRRPGGDLGTILEQPTLETTAGLRRLALVKQLQRRIAAYVCDLPVDQDGVRRLDRHAVSGLVAAFPEFIQPRDSVAFYGQPMIRDGAPSFVLNTTDNGFRRAHARLQRLSARTHNGALPTPELPTDGETVYADLAGIAGSNLNLRWSPAPYEIAYPGSISRRPPAEQIPLGDLEVTHDPANDRLRLVWAFRGLWVVPLHLGMMVDWALPWAYRLLLQAFGVSSFCALPRRLSGLNVIAGGPEVRRVPRLCLGDVVVQRATNHAWANRADRPVRMMFVMVDAAMTDELRAATGPLEFFDQVLE